jgi:hypothetical protein
MQNALVASIGKVSNRRESVKFELNKKIFIIRKGGKL